MPISAIKRLYCIFKAITDCYAEIKDTARNVEAANYPQYFVELSYIEDNHCLLRWSGPIEFVDMI